MVTDSSTSWWPRRNAVLIVSVQDYLHRPLVDLARHLYGDDTVIIPMRAWRSIDKVFLFKLFFWYLPFTIKRIFTPSDLGGRLVRLILDYAALFGIESYVVPAHNHPFHLDVSLTLPQRYVDLSRPRVVGGFSKRTRLILNDRPMRDFFLAMRYEPHRLLVVDDWIGTLYRRDEAITYPVVFFTEVIQEIDRAQFERNLARVVRLLENGIVSRLFVKLHPREPAEFVARYRGELGRFPNTEFIDTRSRSFDVINRSAIIMASFSTVLLEALWLGKKVIVLDNAMFRNTMLNFYLVDGNHLLYDDRLEIDTLRRYCTEAATR